MSEKYKVELDSYNGPLDLLLYLIRQEEVDIYDIPIARITEQYLRYIELVRQIDPDHIGEFLVLAATLMEIKLRTLLPKPPPEEGEDNTLDPRLELVQQLLEYKRFKDAAANLASVADVRAQRFGRIPALLPAPDNSEVDLENVQIWDLLKAFDKVLQQIGVRGRTHEVLYDDTPIALHADDLMDQLGRAGGSLSFVRIFVGRLKGEIIGLFLALLELVRAKRVRVEQHTPEDPLVLHLLNAEPLLSADIDAALDGRQAPPADHAADAPATPEGHGDAMAAPLTPPAESGTVLDMTDEGDDTAKAEPEPGPGDP